MFRRLGAGSGALWRPWYDGGRHGDRELARLRCVVVFCVSFVRKLLPRGNIAREQFLPPVASTMNTSVTTNATVYVDLVQALIFDILGCD